VATTLIRNADFVIAWDAAAVSHVYMPGADVAFEDRKISFVGRGYDEPVDSVIDGRGMMVMPGLVNIHSHPSSEPMNKGLTDEVGSPGFDNSSLYEYLPIFRPDPAAVPNCVRVALSELLVSGVTTVAGLSMAHPGWLDLLAESGMRPARDPLRSLIYAAGDRAVHSVFVDGERVVDAGRLLTIDYAAAAEALHEAQKRVMANVPNLDWGHRHVDEISPPTFRTA
jgi:cytosine/adenosine deaminase-related metal-dependent hydrolase